MILVVLKLFNSAFAAVNLRLSFSIKVLLALAGAGKLVAEWGAEYLAGDGVVSGGGTMGKTPANSLRC